MTRDNDPNFAAPWEAAAFALRAHLVERGLIDATRFSKVLGEELDAGHPAADDGTAYFVAFVRALERLGATLVSDDDLERERAAWRAAADATPHGAPITLPGRPVT